MNRKFSPKVKKIISLSRSEAIRLGHDYIGTEHLLLGMLQDNDNLAVRVLDAMDVDFSELKFKIRSEEHTSELQSQSNLVCRLLLEKKKKKEKILNIILLLHFLSLMLGSILVLMLPLPVWLTPDVRIKKSVLKCNWIISSRLARCKM